MAKNDKQPTTEEQLLDLFVYAPVGVALEVVDNLPKYVERGKSQVTIGRFLAKAAARKGSSTVENVAERLVNDASQVIVDLFGIDLTPDEDDSKDAPTVEPTTTVEADDAGLPIAEYDSQAAAQIVKLLAQLTPAERDQIEAHELAGRNRVTILRKIAQLRDAD